MYAPYTHEIKPTSERVHYTTHARTHACLRERRTRPFRRFWFAIRTPICFFLSSRHARCLLLARTNKAIYRKGSRSGRKTIYAGRATRGAALASPFIDRSPTGRSRLQSAGSAREPCFATAPHGPSWPAVPFPLPHLSLSLSLSAYTLSVGVPPASSIRPFLEV